MDKISFYYSNFNLIFSRLIAATHLSDSVMERHLNDAHTLEIHRRLTL